MAYNLPNMYSSIGNNNSLVNILGQQINPYANVSVAPYQNSNFSNLMNQWNLVGNNPTPTDTNNNKENKILQNLETGQSVMWKDMDMLGKANAVVGTGLDAIKALNAGWGLFSSVSQYGHQKAMNKEALSNAKMKNEALRFDIDNRKAEVARWNQIRSNVNKQMQNASAIKTSY